MTNEAATVSVEQAAKVLGISRESAYRAARRGDLPVIKLGKRILVIKAKLEAMVGGSGGGGA